MYTVHTRHVNKIKLWMQLIDLTALLHIKDTNEHFFVCENCPTSLVIYLSAVFIYGLHSLNVCMYMSVCIYLCMYVLVLYSVICIYGLTTLCVYVI